MPQVFLSHSFKDKKIVLKIRDAFANSLISPWIDEGQIPGGSRLIDKIASGIGKSKYFAFFVSNHYLTSKWCMDELYRAYSFYQQGALVLFPVLLEEMDKLCWDDLSEEQCIFLRPLLNQIKYVSFDPYDEAGSIARLLNDFWMNEKVRFEPIAIETIEGKKIQVIRLSVDKGVDNKGLPTDFLETWDLRIEDFFAGNATHPAVILPDLPVAFFGGAPNWLLAYLLIPFKNQRTVYVYNNTTKDYICVFSLPADHALGDVLKAL